MRHDTGGDLQRLAQATFPGTEWSLGYYSNPIPAVNEDQPQTFLPDVGKNLPLHIVGSSKIGYHQISLNWAFSVILQK